jgi:hypothetical protein
VAGTGVHRPDTSSDTSQAIVRARNINSGQVRPDVLSPADRARTFVRLPRYRPYRTRASWRNSVPLRRIRIPDKLAIRMRNLVYKLGRPKKARAVVGRCPS